MSREDSWKFTLGWYNLFWTLLIFVSGNDEASLRLERKLCNSNM